MPRVQVLKCPQCNAPLRWKGDVEVVECRFCGTHVFTGRSGPGKPDKGTVTDLPAVTVSRRRVSPWPILISTMVMVGIGFGVNAIVNRVMDTVDRVTAPIANQVHQVTSEQPKQPWTPESAGTRSKQRHPLADVLAVQLDTSLPALAAELPGKADDSSLSIHVEPPGPDRIVFEWASGKPDHVSEVRIYATGPHSDAAAILARLRKLIGRRLSASSDDSNYTMFAIGNRLNVARDLSYVSLGVDTDDPHWKQRAEALWESIRALIVGRDPNLDELTRRARLGRGWPLAKLTEVDIDSATTREVITDPDRFLPGLVPRSKDLYRLPLDHAWFEHLDLRFQHRNKGLIYSATLYPWDRTGFRKLQPLAMACIAGVFGKPRESDLDELEGTKRYRWGAGKMRRVYLYPHLMTIELRTSRSRRKVGEDWNKLMKALDSCAPNPE